MNSYDNGRKGYVSLPCELRLLILEYVFADNKGYDVVSEIPVSQPDAAHDGLTAHWSR